jgi:large subunit ribosomal protein L1
MAKYSGKRYKENIEMVDRDRLYEPQEAVDLLKKFKTAKFDETVEVHMRLNIDPRQADQQVRERIVMPAGLGQEVRILVFAEGEGARIAEQAGADIVAGDEEITKIEAGWTEFDVAIAVPEMMRKIGKLGRVLGPRNLMPSPKAGTVVPPEDITRVVEEARAGAIEFRNDRTGNLHVPIGKLSFTADQLMLNLSALMESIRLAKPASLSRVTYIRKLVVTSTMNPGIKINPATAFDLQSEV